MRLPEYGFLSRWIYLFDVNKSLGEVKKLMENETFYKARDVKLEVRRIIEEHSKYDSQFPEFGIGLELGILIGDKEPIETGMILPRDIHSEAKGRSSGKGVSELGSQYLSSSKRKGREEDTDQPDPDEMCKKCIHLYQDGFDIVKCDLQLIAQDCLRVGTRICVGFKEEIPKKHDTHKKRNSRAEDNPPKPSLTRDGQLHPRGGGVGLENAD